MRHRDSLWQLSQQRLSDPHGRFHALDLPLTLHSLATGWMALGPDQRPRSVLRGVFGFWIGRVVVLRDAAVKIISRADVELARSVFKDVGPELRLAACQTPRAGLEPAT